MRRVVRILTIFAGVVVFLVLIGGLFLWQTVRRPWPETEGTLSVPGLQAPVEIVRDEYGVPHIYAQNERDLFFAQGYVHAQDRLWQMDFQRRVGLGRLSEILGEAALETDMFLRTIGTNRSAAQDLQALTPETRQMLQAYADGVNAYIETHRDRLPLEYTILRAEPEPWEPLHTLAWGKMMQWTLNDSWSDDLLRAKLVEALGEEKALQLNPGYLPDAPVILPDVTYASLGTPNVERVRQALDVANLPLGGASLGLGSNNWVVGPDRTATGRPMLANDPHLSYGIPAIWYLMGLHAPGYEVVGASLPGAPGIIIGHNGRIAWGVTNLAADVQDLYIERLNPQNPNEYEVNGQYVPFEVVREEIYVKGRTEPVVLDVKVSRHGPIINDVVEGLEQPVALKWLAASRPSTLVNAIYPLNKARNWEEFTAALRWWDAPMQNFVYADVDGNIGYYGAGTVPIRANGQGLVPVPGWTDEYEWVDTIPFEELPQAFNPPGSLVVTANNKPVSDDYPYYLGHDWAAPNRARRILAHLADRDQLTLEDMAAAQADDVSILGQKLTPLLLNVQSDNIITQRAQAELAKWDNRLAPDSVGAGIFEVTYWFLVQEIVGDELGEELTKEYLGAQSQHVMLVERLLDDPDNPWWDDTTTPQQETRDEIIARALEKAVEWWGRNYGDLVDKDWKWGRIHTTTFRHNVFGKVSPLDRFFNVKAGPTAGDAQTPQANGFSFKDPFDVRAGPSYRQIIDVGNWDASQMVITVGQSGHAFHPNFANLVPFWRDVRYIPMRWSREAVEGAPNKNVLRLEP